MSVKLNPFTGLFDFTGSGGGGGGGGSTSYVQRVTLSPTDISNKFITLPLSPSDAQGVILTVIGGPQQDYSVDYTVTGPQVGWTGTFLEANLDVGDKLVIQYKV